MEPMSNRLLTPHKRQFWAWLLQRKAAGGWIEAPAGTLMDAQIDLNPHQVEAALFACQNTLAKGVILADEVSLGKRIEAGLVVAMCSASRLFVGDGWAQHRRGGGRRRGYRPTRHPLVKKRAEHRGGRTSRSINIRF